MFPILETLEMDIVVNLNGLHSVFQADGEKLMKLTLKFEVGDELDHNTQLDLMLSTVTDNCRRLAHIDLSFWYAPVPILTDLSCAWLLASFRDTLE